MNEHGTLGQERRTVKGVKAFVQQPRSRNRLGLSKVRERGRQSIAENADDGAGARATKPADPRSNSEQKD